MRTHGPPSSWKDSAQCQSQHGPIHQVGISLASCPENQHHLRGNARDRFRSEKANQQNQRYGCERASRSDKALIVKCATQAEVAVAKVQGKYARIDLARLAPLSLVANLYDLSKN